MKHSLKLYLKTFSPNDNLKQHLIKFATLTNFVALKGGTLKKEQMLSGDMADIFSNIYLALSVEYYHRENNISKTLSDYIVKRLILENELKVNKIIDNLGFEKYLLQHLKTKPKNVSYKKERVIFEEIMNNEKIINNIKTNIHTKIIQY